MFGALVPEIDDKAFLAAHGVRFALQGHLPFMAAVEATRATMQALRDGVKPKDITGVATDALIKRLSREDDYKKAIADFLEP
jgi:carboxyvinyl-carboxyphosphonate phosphorylmutase